MQNTTPRRQARGDMLSNELTHWIADPVTAFQSWTSEEAVVMGSDAKFHHTSISVYTDMWRHFVRESEHQGVAFHISTPQDLLRFLNGLDANLEHRTRYRLLLARVFEYLRELGLKHDNPALSLFEDDFMTSKNDVMPFLTKEQRSDLLHVLYDNPVNLEDQVWNQGLALSSLLLGAGLKLGEALRCTVSCIDLSGSPGWVDLPVPIAIRPHRTMMISDAIPTLQGWLNKASKRKTLFPSPRVTSKGRSIDAASAFRAIVRVSASIESMAGAAQRISPQTLRNTYLAILVDQGHSAELLTEYMGFSRRSSAHRAIQAYENWQSGDRSLALPKSTRRQLPLI